MTGARRKEQRRHIPRSQGWYLGKGLVVWFGWDLTLRNCFMVFKRLLGFEDMKPVENVMRPV